MAPTAQSHTNPRRTVLVLLLLAALVASVGHAQTPPVRMSPADAPFPDLSGAQWTKLEGPSGQKFLTAILRPEGTGSFPVVVMLQLRQPGHMVTLRFTAEDCIVVPGEA